ncbi:hypothetical protein GJ496_007434 [Pomphorhynchus laevis]|nr:hypothetical protein GJ496_007434 [Pomphorhynchus laevis]
MLKKHRTELTRILLTKKEWPDAKMNAQWLELKQSSNFPCYLSFVINTCYEEYHRWNLLVFPDVARSAYSALQNCSNPSSSILSKYCLLMSALSTNTDGSDDVRKCGLNLLDNIQSLTVNDRSNLARYFISQRNYFACHKILKSSPAFVTKDRSFLIDTCIDNGDTSNAFKLLEGWKSCHNSQSIDKLLSCISNDTQATQFLDFVCQSNDLVLNRQQINTLRSMVDRLKWKCTLDRPNETGYFENFGLHLPSIKLTENEFLNLRTEINRKLINNNEIFMKSDRLEYDQFCSLIQSKQYDVVADAANLVYMICNQNLIYSIDNSALLHQAALHLKSVNLGRILFICKRHLIAQRFKHNLSLLKSVADIFITATRSHDDLYILKAASHSGRNCRILSADRFRDHQAILIDAETQKLFRRWCLSNQLYFAVSISKQIYSIPPIQYAPYAYSFTDGNYAIPIQTLDATSEPQRGSHIPNDWLIITSRA